MTTRRHGFALTELLISMVIAGIIGIALTRLVLNQARFVGMQDAMMRARGGARAATNVMVDELRMVTGGGVIAAARDSITVRVPYAFGIACLKSSGYTTMSLLPADSATYFGATPSGYAWRNAAGRYVFHEPAAVVDNVSDANCLLTGITTLSAPGWTPRAVNVSQNLMTDTATAMYLYQKVSFAFAPSVELPGRLALWRTVLSSGVSEELVAPFDTASRFSFLVGTRYTPQAAPPFALDSLRGLRLRLKAASETAPQGRSVPATFDVSIDLFFRNYAP